MLLAELSKYKRHKLHFLDQARCGGVRVWSKETGLGPVAIGLHGFKPHPPHSIVLERLKLSTSRNLTLKFQQPYDLLCGIKPYPNQPKSTDAEKL